MRTLQERFDEKYNVADDGCWLWTACLGGGDYGTIKVKGKMKGAHRVSYELHRGVIPEGEGYHGICVCHTCDVKSCVNPDHLFLGTNQDNSDDREEKGRGNQPKGSKVGTAKLTESDIPKIRKLLKQSVLTQREIAAKFGVSAPLITYIKLGKRWKHLQHE